MLTVSKLVVRHPGFHLGPVSFSAAPGEFVCVVGPNGSGKSTLITALLGLLAPAEGSGSWQGSDLSARDPAVVARIRFVSDSADDVFAQFSADEFWQYCRGVRDRAVPGIARSARDRAARLARALDYPDPAKPLTSCSLGTRRKAQLVAALQCSPELLVLDEPFIGLDFMAARAFEEVLRECVAEGTTVLSSSHDLDLAARIATRLLVLTDGELRLDERVAEVGGVDALESHVLDAIRGARRVTT